jgi:tyrosyl-DNA phosphodiesterase 2
LTDWHVDICSKEPSKQIKFMTYNVWSREDIVLYRRMQAIGRLVEKHSPDVIFFQVEIQGSPDPI